MDHHQREQRRAAAEAFNESLEQLAACFQEDLSATEFLASPSHAEGDEHSTAEQATAALPPKELPAKPYHQKP